MAGTPQQKTTKSKIRVTDGTDGKFTATPPGREGKEFEVKNGVIELDAADVPLVLSAVSGHVIDEDAKDEAAATPTG